MSKVYVAVASGPAGFNKLVVLKVLEGALAHDPEFVTMFLDEARLAARLNHANVVQTNEVGSEGERYFIAMEFLEGQPLHRVMKRAAAASGKVPLGLFLRILSKTLEGLHAAHTAKDFSGEPLNMVHRDVSPHNVFVTYDGQVKIVDFGIARANGRASEVTRVGVLKGKVVYMPPEQVQGGTVDGRADVFALGVALFDHLSRRRLWDGRSEVEIVAKLMNRDYPLAPVDAAADIPAELEAICKKALAPDPNERYADARAMQSDIEAFLVGHRLTTTDRELGDYVTKLFERDRSEIDAVIQTQLRKLVDNPAVRLSDTPLPMVGKLATTTATTTLVTDTQLGAGVSVAPTPVRKSRFTVSVAVLLALIGVALLAVALRRREPATMSREAPHEEPSVAVAVAPPPLPMAATATALATGAPSSLTVAPAASPPTSAGASAPLRVPARVPVVAAAPPPKASVGAPAAVPPPAIEATPPPPPPPPPRSTRPDLGY